MAQVLAQTTQCLGFAKQIRFARQVLGSAAQAFRDSALAWQALNAALLNLMQGLQNWKDGVLLPASYIFKDKKPLPLILFEDL